jgi:hypothetical protein
MFILLFCGCNSDVFIDDPGETEETITLNSEGDEKSLRIKLSDWYLYNIKVEYSQPHKTTMYNNDGEVTEYCTYARNWFEKLCLDFKTFNLTVYNNNYKTLTIRTDENLSNEACIVTLILINDYGLRKEIKLDIEAGEGCKLDNISFDMENFTYQLRTFTNKYAISNIWDKSLKIQLPPYYGVNDVYQFVSKDDIAFYLLENQEIEVPIFHSDALSIGGAKINFYKGVIQSPTSDDIDMEYKEVQPNTSMEYYIKSEYHQITTPYTMTIMSKRSKNTITFKGDLVLLSPIKSYSTLEIAK